MKSENFIFVSIALFAVIIGSFSIGQRTNSGIPPAIAKAINELSSISPERPEKFFGSHTEVFKTLLPVLEKNFVMLDYDKKQKLRGITYTKGMVFLCFAGSTPDIVIEANGEKKVLLGPIQDEYQAVTTLGDLKEAARKKG